MTNPNFFIGAPIQFKKGVKIYPPFVKDIINNPRFGVYEKLLTYTQEDIEDELVESGKKIDSFPTPLEFLMTNCQHSKEYRQLCQEAFEFFLKEKVTFLFNEKLIVVGDIQAILPSIKSLDDLVLIKEEEFFAFQNLIRESVGGKPVDAPDPNMHPRLKAMKAKARLRDRVKAKQAAKNGVNLTTTLASICCMGIGITPLNVGEMSYVAVQTITQVYQNKEKYQLDIDSLLAGADSKKVKRILLITSFPFHQRGQLDNWLTRNPQRVMTMGISWENEVIKIELYLQNYKFDKSQSLHWCQ